MIAQSTLFHFTSELETLLIILSERRLRASYNVEDISDYYPNQRFAAIPMICFCDIPLKFVSEHPMGYGKFGIGLKKDWGLGNGINPVLYRSENFIVNSFLGQIIQTVMLRIAVLERKGSAINASELLVLNELISVQDKTMRLSAFSKKYITNEVLNYVDREWRFVPQNAEIPFLRRQNQRDKLNRNYFKRSPDHLSFTTKDIKYLISPTKRETKKIIKALMDLPLSEYEKYHLAQLVVDLKSIKEDF